MANETFLDASGATKYRKSTGAGSAGDPAVAHNIIDGTVTVTGAGGTFPVTDSGGSLTVDGTVAATQSGTWNVTNISGTISLPTGAATSALQTTGNSSIALVAEAYQEPGTIPASPNVVLLGGLDSGTARAATVDGSGRLTALSIQSGTWTVTGAGGTFPVTDSGGTLTVDAPVGAPVFVRLSDGSAAITTLPVSLASVPSHAVTNAGTFAVQVSSALPAGTNNIGDVDIVSGTITTVTTVTNLSQMGGVAIALGAGATTSGTQRVAVASDSTIGLQAGTAIIGQVVQRPDVSNASDGALTLTPKFARLSTASTGNQAIVAAVTGKKIRVLAMNIMATASTNAVWINDGTNDLHGNTTYKIPLDVTGATGAGGFVLPYCQLGWFETAATNRPLNINLGSANGITAIVTYVEV